MTPNGRHTIIQMQRHECHLITRRIAYCQQNDTRPNGVGRVRERRYVAERQLRSRRMPNIRLSGSAAPHNN